MRATAPGKITFAGYRGGYGNMVEIDHGYGLHTRYGHLSQITVRKGATIDKGSNVGRVGSTGRSTGPHIHYEVLHDNVGGVGSTGRSTAPHVHYEIWHDNVVKNPNNFIEAGRNVL